MSNVVVYVGLVVQVITALGVLFNSVMNTRAARRQSVAQGELKELKVSIDGRLGMLLQLSTAQGELSGRAAERADTATELAAASDRASRLTALPWVDPETMP